jgi:hypothetical protein
MSPAPRGTFFQTLCSLPAWSALLCAFVVGGAGRAEAQSLAGLGAINGTVEDPQGAVVAKASVEVSNSSLGIDRKLTATDAGLFFAPSLPPAPGYSVTVTAPGFNTAKAEGIVVHVGEEIAIPVQLSIAGEKQTITVSESSAPILDSTKTEVSALVSQQQIMDLPINGRRVDQFALLTPGVVPDSTSGELSFHGVPSGNEFLQDGIDITQQWSVQDAGGTAALSNISMDAIQEFRTEIFGYSAEFGRGSGGVVNSLTKSGSNQLHGSAFWFFRNRTLNAIDLFSKLNGRPYSAPEYRHQFGGNVGGPLVKDKLFFFGAYEGTIRNFPLISSIINSSILNSSGQLLPTACTATAAQCAAVQTYLNRFFKTVSRTLHQNDGFVKFDYRQNDKSSNTANFNLMNYFANHDGTNAVAPTDGSGASGSNYNVGTHVRNVRLSNTYLLSPTMVNEARFGFNAERRFQGLPTDLLPPDNILSGLTVAGQANLGVSQNQLPNIQPTEKRFILADSLSESKGKHQLKFGVDLAYLRSVENAVFSGPGAYTYSSVTAFAYDLTPMSTDPVSASQGPGKHYSTFQQAIGHPITGITIRDYDFFAQDQWQLSPSLLLNLGLRYEYATFTQPSAPSYQSANPAAGPINQPKKDFAPRIGLSYSLNGGKTLVRANYGIFYNRLPGASITRLQQLGGVIRKSFTLSSNSPAQFAVEPTFPNIFTSLSQVNSVLSPSSINSGFAIPNLATPYVQEFSLGVEHEVAGNMSFSVAYVGSRGVKFLQRSDLNALEPNGTDAFSIYNTSGNPTGKSFSIPVYFNAANGNTAYNPNFGRILQIDNAGRLWYDGLIAEFHQRENRYVQSTIAYTYSHSEDLGQGTASSNYYFTDQGDTVLNGASTINGRSGYSYEKGSSLEDQRHRLVISALLSAPKTESGSTFAKEAINGWQLAPIFTYASPQYVDTDITAGGLSAGALGGLVTGGTDGRLYISSTLSGIGGESPGGIRASFLPTANLPLGHTVQLDGRLTKTFSIHESQAIELSFEAINALNHIRFTGVNQTGYKSGWNSTTNTGYVQQVSGVGAGTASGGFPDGTNARRAQASFRYTF